MLPAEPGVAVFGAARNPFAAARVRPGALDYVLPDGVTPEMLLARFEAAGRRGQVVGPHGSGKSTLLASLERGWGCTGSSVVRWRAGREATVPWPARRGVLLVDEYDSLPRWRRAWLRAASKRRAVGLVVSAHADVGLPMLWECRPDAATLARVVEGLLDGHDMLAPDAAALQTALAQCGGDMRQVLFDLYDRYEAQAMARWAEDAA